MPKRRSGRLPENKKQRAKKVKSNHNSPSSTETTGSSNQASMKSKTASIRTGAKLTVENPSVLNPDVRDVLPMIINKLDTRSFVKLARTCKYMNKICFSSSDIKIPFERIRYLRVHENYEHSTLRIESGKGVFHCYTDRSRFLKKLIKMPFVYIIKFFRVSSLINDNLLMEIRNYFSKFPRVIIRNITGIRGVDNWDALIEFIQDFHVESLGGLRADVPLGVLSFITQNMKRVDYEGHIPDYVILSATSEHLFLHNAAISLSTFKELVKRYQSGLIGDSIVGLGWADDGEDPFVKACSEVMEIVHVDDINELVMKPSVIFVGENSHYLGRKFSLLKYDGSIGIFYIKRKKVVFC